MSRCESIPKCAVSELAQYALLLVFDLKRSAGVRACTHREDYVELTPDQENAFSLGEQVNTTISVLKIAGLIEHPSVLASFNPEEWDGVPTGTEYPDSVREFISDLGWWAHMLSTRHIRKAGIRPLRKRHHYPDPTSDQIEAFDIKDRITDTINLLVAEGAMDPLWHRVDFEVASLELDKNGEWTRNVEFTNENLT